MILFCLAAMFFAPGSIIPGTFSPEMVELSSRLQLQFQLIMICSIRFRIMICGFELCNAVSLFDMSASNLMLFVLRL